MRINLFTVEEANQMVAEIRPRLEKLRAQKREFDRLDTRFAVLQMATEGAAQENPDAIELINVAGKRSRLGQVIARGLSRLDEQGVLVRDLDVGLCDFYSLKGDRLVFLCWRLDEPELAHWHGLEEGFAGRQPLRKAKLD